MITQAQQKFLDALNALAAEQRLSFSIPEGHVFLTKIESSLDGGGLLFGPVRRHLDINFEWCPALQGEQFYDVDSTATDLRERHALGGLPAAQIGAGA